MHHHEEGHLQFLEGGGFQKSKFYRRDVAIKTGMSRRVGGVQARRSIDILLNNTDKVLELSNHP